MNILFLQLKKYLRNKRTFIAIILLVGFLLFTRMGGDSMGITVGVNDLDQTNNSRWIYESLSDDMTFINVSEAEMRNYMMKQKIMAHITIPKGYSDSQLTNTPMKISMKTIDESPYSSNIMSMMNQNINILKSVVNNYSEDEWEEKLHEVNQGKITLTESFNKSKDFYSIRSALSNIGILLIGLLYLSSSLVNQMKADKDENRVQRVLTTPISQHSYVGQQVLSFLIVNITVTSIFLLVIKVVYNITFGSSIIAIIGVLSLFSLFAIMLSFIGVILANDIKLLNNMTTLGVMLMTMLGGCLWPVAIMPKPMQYIAEFMPTYWVNVVISDIMVNGGIANSSFYLGALIALVVIIFIYASTKKIEVVNR